MTQQRQHCSNNNSNHNNINKTILKMHSPSWALWNVRTFNKWRETHALTSRPPRIQSHSHRSSKECNNAVAVTVSHTGRYLFACHCLIVYLLPLLIATAAATAAAAVWLFAYCRWLLLLLIDCCSFAATAAAAAAAAAYLLFACYYLSCTTCCLIACLLHMNVHT